MCLPLGSKADPQSGAPLSGLEVRLVLELPKAPGSRQAALVVYACEVDQENDIHSIT